MHGKDSRASYLVLCSRALVYKRRADVLYLVLFFTQQFDLVHVPTLKFPLGEFQPSPDKHNPESCLCTSQRLPVPVFARPAILAISPKGQSTISCRLVPCS